VALSGDMDLNKYTGWLRECKSCGEDLSRIEDPAGVERLLDPPHEGNLDGGEGDGEEALLGVADTVLAGDRSSQADRQLEDFPDGALHVIAFDVGQADATLVIYKGKSLLIDCGIGVRDLNRAYRERFLATKHKVVILPPCMCAPVEECKAVDTPLGAKCQACTPGCRVHQVTKLGEKLGFGVTMIPDDMKVFGSGNSAEPPGLLGVSCALTNWNGGWDAGAIGIPCQGLLLDYVGCKYHWDKNGIPTDTNLKKLREILGV